MKAEIAGNELLIYPETRTEKVAMIAFLDESKKNDTIPTIITLDELVKTLPEAEAQK